MSHGPEDDHIAFKDAHTNTYATRGDGSKGDNQRSRGPRNQRPGRERVRANQRNAGSMGLRPTQPIGTKDAKQTAEIYARISQETFDQVCWGRR